MKGKGGHMTVSVAFNSGAARLTLRAIFLASAKVPGFIFQLPTMRCLDMGLF
jgi:hypothetical protein